MSKFGQKKEETASPKVVAQLMVVLLPDGTFKTGIQVEPGNKELVASFLLGLTNTQIFAVVMKQLLTSQPKEAEEIASYITSVSRQNSDTPVISPLEFGRQLLSQNEEE